MNRTACSFLLVVGVASCGQTLDVGHDTTAARVLTRFESLPDFTPTAVAWSGDAVYVGGVSFPHREYDVNATDIGRIVRVPLDGSPPREVWRGPYFRGPLIAYGTRIVFTETDPNNVLSPPTLTYGGIDMLDTATNTVTQIPNVAGRDFVSAFAFGANGLVWAGSSMQLGTTPYDFSATLVRWRDSSTTAIAVLPRGPGTLFTRGNDMLLDLLVDGSPSGIDEPTTTSLQHAIFRVGSALERERTVNELPSVDTNNAVQPQSEIIAGDDARYYVTTRTTQGTYFSSIPRAASTSMEMTFPTILTSLASGSAQVDAGQLYWVPADSPAMIRRRPTADTSTQGDEIYLDGGRQVFSLVVGSSELYWLSTSHFDQVEPYRIMAHAK